MLHMKFSCDWLNGLVEEDTDGRTDGRRTLSDHNSSPRAIAQEGTSPPPIFQQEGMKNLNTLAATIFSRTRKNAPLSGSHFHEDRTINMASRVKNAPPLGSHVFQANVAIFELIQDIMKTNLLTKFHEDWTINVASRVRNAPPPGGHVFKATKTIFEHYFQDIIGTYLLTKFHEDRKINVASRVLTRKNAPPPGGHVFQPTSIIFGHIQDIIWMNFLTKFHEDNKYSHVDQNLTKFHEDWTINVASLVLTRLSFFNRLFTCFHYIHIEKTVPPPGSHVFPPIMTIFELAKNVTSRVKMTPSCGLVFLRIRTIFELNRRIQKTNVLTKFHEDWTNNVTSRVFTCFHYIHLKKTVPSPCSHVFSPIWTIFQLVRDINKTNGLTKFHNDWAKIVTSRVFTRFLYSHIRNTAPPPGGHIFQRTGTISQLNQHIIKTNILTHFELSRGMNGTNVLTKFREDRTINMASGVLTRQMLTPHNAQRTTHDGQRLR
ncbi:hypothetical protein DPMN_191084 [Dreissena polymorpha]|uniref:Uncharacterized protein n=1 Tax=Dreissena polymorpha TaxID=45954 RepID=A0A9D3XYL5_DREPO|nr:hypothetical protein DPMN_191084 [Dreissena polymorpha]